MPKKKIKAVKGCSEYDAWVKAIQKIKPIKPVKAWAVMSNGKFNLDLLFYDKKFALSVVCSELQQIRRVEVRVID